MAFVQNQDFSKLSHHQPFYDVDRFTVVKSEEDEPTLIDSEPKSSRYVQNEENLLTNARPLTTSKGDEAHGRKGKRRISPTDRAEQRRIKVIERDIQSYNEVAPGTPEHNEVDLSYSQLKPPSHSILVHNLPQASIREIKLIFAAFEPYHVRPLGLTGRATGGKGPQSIRNFCGSAIISLSNEVMQKKAVQNMNNAKVEGHTITVLAWIGYNDHINSLRDVDQAAFQNWHDLLGPRELAQTYPGGFSRQPGSASMVAHNPALMTDDHRFDQEISDQFSIPMRENLANIAPDMFEKSSSTQVALTSNLNSFERGNSASWDAVKVLLEYCQSRWRKAPIFKDMRLGRQFSFTVKIHNRREPFGKAPRIWFSNKRAAKQYVCKLAVNWLMISSLISVCDVTSNMKSTVRKSQQAQKSQGAHEGGYNVQSSQARLEDSDIVDIAISDHLENKMSSKSGRSIAALKNCEETLKLAAKKIKEARRSCNAEDLILVANSLRASFSKDFFSGLDSWNTNNVNSLHIERHKKRKSGTAAMQN